MAHFMDGLTSRFRGQTDEILKNHITLKKKKTHFFLNKRNMYTGAEKLLTFTEKVKSKLVKKH